MNQDMSNLIEQLNAWHETVQSDDLAHKILHAKLIEAIVTLTHEVEDLKKQVAALQP